jgi:hypothetical protein
LQCSLKSSVFPNNDSICYSTLPDSRKSEALGRFPSSAFCPSGKKNMQTEMGDGSGAFVEGTEMVLEHLWKEQQKYL